MSKYPMTSPIASREFKFEHDGVISAVRLVIGMPNAVARNTISRLVLSMDAV